MSDPSRVDILQLDMHYDDAFVAYINGTEVTRSNFSGTATWNSIADTDRTDSAAITAEEFFIPAVPGLLQAGEKHTFHTKLKPISLVCKEPGLADFGWRRTALSGCSARQSASCRRGPGSLGRELR